MPPSASRRRLVAFARIAVAHTFIAAFTLIAVIARHMLAGAAFLLVDLADDAVIMLGMLEIIFRRHPVTRGMGVADELMDSLPNLERPRRERSAQPPTS